MAAMVLQWAGGRERQSQVAPSRFDLCLTRPGVYPRAHGHLPQKIEKMHDIEGVGV